MILIRTFPRNFKDLQELVGSRFLSDQLVACINQRIDARIRRIVIEYPYVDKDYRDTYYNDFSKRHGVFDRNCIRLHFFVNEFSDILNDLTNDTYPLFRDSYRGFIILRDTKVRTIGRSYLDPNVITKRAEGFMCVEKISAHLRGFNFSARAFPWMQQDGNITRCAHVALWSIIRYFSDKYSYYPEITLHQITEMLESEQRKNPSVGMTIEQIAQVFRDSRFSPGIYFRETMSDNSFNRLLYVIIESGLPYVATLTQGTGEGHAIAIIGHGPVSDAVAELDGRNGIVDTCELVDYLIASDDNHLPYTRVEKNSTHILNKNGHLYAYSNIGAVVVPYYEKMFLDISAIFGGTKYKGCLELIENNYLGLPKTGVIVRRVLLTSSKSYKAFMVKNCLDKTLSNLISLVEMPKFIWLAEYSLPEEFNNGETGWCVILDATAMNYQQDIFITIRHRERLIVNRGVVYPNAETPLEQYLLETNRGIRYTNNLEAM
jgi:hypothetical protein